MKRESLFGKRGSSEFWLTHKCVKRLDKKQNHLKNGTNVLMQLDATFSCVEHSVLLLREKWNLIFCIFIIFNVSSSPFIYYFIYYPADDLHVLDWMWNFIFFIYILFFLVKISSVKILLKFFAVSCKCIHCTYDIHACEYVCVLSLFQWLCTWSNIGISFEQWNLYYVYNLCTPNPFLLFFFNFFYRFHFILHLFKSNE